ncbi:MAG: hypothetical protein ACKVQT_22990 [Burkholderiales bacterium]
MRNPDGTMLRYLTPFAMLVKLVIACHVLRHVPDGSRVIVAAITCEAPVVEFVAERFHHASVHGADRTPDFSALSGRDQNGSLGEIEVRGTLIRGHAG